MTDLLERVAREMCIADERNGSHSWEHLIASGIDPLAHYKDKARAAIAVVLEEAAQIADEAGKEPLSMFPSDQSRLIAAAIRALKDCAP